MYRIGSSRRLGDEVNSKLRARREAMPSRKVPGEGMSRGELADAVNAYLWKATGERYDLDARAVARYERGHVSWPRAAYRSAFRAVLGVDSDSELGFEPTARGTPYGTSSAAGAGAGLVTQFQDTGLAYAPSITGTIETISLLSKLDENDRLAFNNVDFSEEAVNSAALEWLVGKADSDVHATGSTITVHDIEEIVATTVTIDRLDREVGGNFSRDVAVRFLRDRVLPKLHQPCRSALRRDLFQAASVLCEIVGYMTFDLERHGLAQRYFVQALRLAKEADHTAYGAYVLTTVSHQALYVDNATQALRMAQAAKLGYKGGLIPAVPTEAALLEATAYSVLGDATSCTKSLREAEHHFDRNTDEIPQWASHWGPEVFASFVGGCWLNLGNTKAARPHLEFAWQESNRQARRVVFTAGQLGKLSVLDGDLDEAVSYALTATHAAGKAKSKRSLKVVRELRELLDVHKDHTSVRDFNEQALTVLDN
jgi:hypothetical protein